MLVPTEEDMNWPARFREEEANYSQFYTQPTKSICIMRLYAGMSGDLESVKRSHHDLEKEGTFSERELGKVIAQGSHIGSTRYRLTTGGVFSVAIGPESVESFVATDWKPDVWTPLDVSSTSSIELPETVHALGRETTLVLVYRQRPAVKKRQTARVSVANSATASARTTRRPRKGLKRLTLKS
jgi:hypothetical protein